MIARSLHRLRPFLPESLERPSPDFHILPESPGNPPAGAEPSEKDQRLADHIRVAASPVPCRERRRTEGRPPARGVRWISGRFAPSSLTPRPRGETGGHYCHRCRGRTPGNGRGGLGGYWRAGPLRGCRAPALWGPSPAGSASLRPCGLAALRPCGLAALRPCGLAALRPCGLAALRPCGLAALRPCGLAAWRPLRGLAAWRPGGLAAWRPLRGLAAWRPGGLAAWRPGGLAAWRPGGLAAWRPCGLAALRPLRGLVPRPRLSPAARLLWRRGRPAGRRVRCRGVRRGP
ncbi:hypothetical protein FB470_006206 [Amycolatopsis thermophila]|uniref:Uncharacterized protein n=1 Tax=Amycolatopsis thermophila TaxID=206084 RepID=A0ABU0F3T1_9PSEU|nr:hypothetical protein [Amycolatopsis thermophila]